MTHRLLFCGLLIVLTASPMATGQEDVERENKSPSGWNSPPTKVERPATTIAWNRHVIVGHAKTGINSAVASDYDGDGGMDVIASYEGSVFIHQSFGWRRTEIHKFDPANSRNKPRGACIHSCLIDVDGDGDQDFVGSNQTLFWLECPDDPFSGKPWKYRTVDDEILGSHCVLAGDVNQDGKMDLIANSFQDETKTKFPHSIVWLEIPEDWKTAKKWTRHVFADRDAPGGSHYMGLGDLNNDGRPDITCGAKGEPFSNGEWFAWWEQPADPTKVWKKHLLSDKQPGASNIHPVNVDGDKQMDIVATRGHGKGVLWFKGPDFQEIEIDGEIVGPHTLVTDDLDNDGDIDVAVCGRGDDGIAAWYQNDGTGKFQKFEFDKGQGSYDLRAVDMDGDGDLDLLNAGHQSNNVVWYENRLQKDIEITIGPNDGADCLKSLPNVHGTLTIINMRPDVNTQSLGLLSKPSIVFKGGTMNFAQLQPVPSAGGGNYPVMQDVAFENKPGSDFDKQLYIVYESSSAKATSSMLAAIEKTKFTQATPTHPHGGVLTLKLGHELSADDWLRLSKFSANTNESISILVFLYFGDVEGNREAFRKLPPNYRLSPATLIFNKSDTDAQIFSEDQVRHLLEGEFKFQQMDPDPWNAAPLSKPQYQAAFELAFAAKRRADGLSIDPDPFIESLLTSKFKSVKDYHWFFATDDLNKKNPNTGLALPVVTDKTIQCAVENFSELEILCLGNHLLPLLDIGPGSAGYEAVSLEPISKLSNLEELLISRFGEYKSFSSLGSLDNLRKLYLYECPEDLSWVCELANLEVLVLNLPDAYDAEKTFGFIAQNDSRIKSITMFDGLPSEGLLKEIAKLPNLEDVTIVHDSYEIPSEVQQVHELTKQLLKNVKVVSDVEFDEPIPDAYRNHRQRTRKMVRKKYLDGKPRL